MFFFFDDEQTAQLVEYSEQTFESIKHVNEAGQEYWLARELQKVLEYSQWRRFQETIERAKQSCKNSGIPISEHFADVGKSYRMPNGGEREIGDIMLSRYACYLIVMNGDAGKQIIALGQTYFAVKTRQQELIEDYEQLSENQKRLSIRSEMVEHNKSLAEAAKMSGKRKNSKVEKAPEAAAPGVMVHPIFSSAFSAFCSTAEKLIPLFSA